MGGSDLLDPEILAATQRTEGFGAYSARILSIHAHVSEAVGVPVYYKQGSNYESSDRLVIFFDGRGRTTANDYHRAASLVQVLVSYKGPFFTHLFLRKDGSNVWRYASTGRSKRIPVLIARAAAELRRLGLRAIPEDVLRQPAPGQVTELEGIPATVYESLFSELP